MTDQGRRLAQERTAGGNQRRALERVLARHGADPEPAIVVPEIRQLADPIQVDQAARPGQAHVHERDQALAPGEELGLFAVASEDLHGRVHCPRIEVFEGSGLHQRATEATRPRVR